MKQILYLLLLISFLHCTSMQQNAKNKYHFPTYQVTTADNKSGMLSFSATLNDHNSLKIIKQNETKINKTTIQFIKTVNSKLLLKTKNRKTIELKIRNKLNTSINKSIIEKITIKNIILDY